MNCDRFERVLLDLLYDELDELTRAAAHRHSDQCQRCRALIGRLRTTRELGILPLEPAPEGFESRVLAAERQVHRGLPWTERLARSVTIIGGYAMRPQLAMAALALLMIGTSLLFLRPKPGSHASAVHVTQRGIPRAEPEQFVVPIDEAPAESEPVAEAAEPEQAPPEPEPPPPSATVAAVAASPPSAPPMPSTESERELDLARERAEDRAYTAAMNAFRESNHTAAQKQFDAIVSAGGRNAPAAELYAALATEAVLGCAAALPRFDSVAAKYTDSHLAHTATWHSASCRSLLGLDRRAALDFERLLGVPAYAAKARVALSQVGTDAVDRNRSLRANDKPLAVPVVNSAGAGVAAPSSPQTNTQTQTASSAEAGKPQSAPGSANPPKRKRPGPKAKKKTTTKRAPSGTSKP